MALERFANDLGTGTALATALTDTTGTAVVVSSVSPLPALPQYRIRIDNELMLVTGVSGTTLTVQRGIEGSTAATHAPFTSVFHVLTAASLRAAGLPWAAWPASGGFTVPDLTTFTWVNQGGATATQLQSSLTLSDPTAAGLHWRMLKLSTFPTAPYTITIYAQTTYFLANNHWFGLYWGNGTALVTAQIRSANTPALIATVDKWTNNSTLSANYMSLNLATPNLWQQISDTGTQRVYRLSADGVSWTQVHTIGNTDFLTPTEVGLAFQVSQGQTPALTSSLVSFKVT